MLAGFAVLARAQDPGNVNGQWTFTAAFYTWLAGVDGTVAVFGAPAVDADASFSDTLEKFDAGIMGIGEARRGRFSLAADVFWVRLSEEHDVPLEPLANRVKLTTENAMLTVIGGYRLIDNATADLDVIAGGRAWSVDNKLSFGGGGLDGRSTSDGESWVDPVIGFRGSAGLGAKYYLTGWAITGDFGGGSDAMRDAMLAVGYRFSDRCSAVAGYRILEVDFRKDSFVYDVEQTGLMLGAVFNF
jgi:hypothetical protein